MKFQGMVSHDDIHPNQSKQRSSGEEVFVVGVDLCEAVFGGGGEMEGIGGAEVGGGWRAGEGLLDAVEDGLGERKELEVSCGRIGLHLGNGQLVFGLRRGAFPNLSECGRCILGATMGGDSEDIDRSCMGADFGGAVLGALELEEIVGVVVGLVHRASRSSEMICVESVPPLKAPALRAASNSGSSFLVAQ